MIEVINTTTAKLYSVNIQVAPYDRRREVPEKSSRKLQKGLGVVSVPAVLALLWAPMMPQSERAKSVCNAVIKSWYPLRMLEDPLT